MTSIDYHNLQTTLFNAHSGNHIALDAISKGAGLAAEYAFFSGQFTESDLRREHAERQKLFTDPAHQALYRESFRLASSEICAAIREALDAKEVVNVVA